MRYGLRFRRRTDSLHVERHSINARRESIRILIDGPGVAGFLTVIRPISHQLDRDGHLRAALVDRAAAEVFDHVGKVSVRHGERVAVDLSRGSKKSDFLICTDVDRRDRGPSELTIVAKQDDFSSGDVLAEAYDKVEVIVGVDRFRGTFIIKDIGSAVLQQVCVVLVNDHALKGLCFCRIDGKLSPSRADRSSAQAVRNINIVILKRSDISVVPRCFFQIIDVIDDVREEVGVFVDDVGDVISVGYQLDGDLKFAASGIRCRAQEVFDVSRDSGVRHRIIRYKRGQKLNRCVGIGRRDR